MEEIKDLGIKIGTPEEVLWTKIKKSAEDLIVSSKIEIVVQEEILKLAEKNIKK